MEVLKFGGASRENPGISDGFHGLDLTVGDAPRGDGAELLVAGAELLVTEEDRVGVGADFVPELELELELELGTTAAGGPEARREVAVGVADLLDEDWLLGAPAAAADEERLEVGVEDLAVVGVDDLGGAAAAGLVDEVMLAREVGVEEREGLEEVTAGGCLGRPVGVAGLDETELRLRPPDDEGRRVPTPEALEPEEEIGCLETRAPTRVGAS